MFIKSVAGIMFAVISMSVNTANANHLDSVEQEVSQATKALYTALSQADAKTFAKYLPPEGFTEFNPEWQGVRRLNMSLFENIFKAGAKIDLNVADIKVQTLGDTAIVTGFRVGSITAPVADAKPVHSRLALTMIWSKSLGEWKLQHVHLSDEK